MHGREREIEGCSRTNPKIPIPPEDRRRKKENSNTENIRSDFPTPASFPPFPPGTSAQAIRQVEHSFSERRDGAVILRVR
jgi:hypothetical protein